MKKIVLLTLSIIALMSLSVYSWEGDTHRGITGEVAGPSKTLGEYLKSVGIPGGDQAIFSLSEDFYWPEDFRERWEDGEVKPETWSAMDWLIDGAVNEDAPMIRASHHFHDPTTGEGWDERGACLAVLAYLEYKGFGLAGTAGLLTGPAAIALADIIAKGNFTHGK